MPELWNCDVALLKKLGHGVLPISVSAYGPSWNSDIKINIGYGLNLTEKFSAGLFVYSDYHIIVNHKNSFFSGFLFGVQYELNRYCIVGMKCELPTIFSRNVYSDLENIILETAISYSLFDKGKINCGIRKILYKQLEVIASFECAMLKHVNVFVGYHSGSNEIVCGLTYNIGNITVMASAGCNFQLGITPEIQLLRLY